MSTRQRSDAEDRNRDGAAPVVSIIMPAYNVSEFIADALTSVRAQTFRDFEVIVVNDGSPDTDALERALEPFRDEIRVVAFPDNRGLSAARNAGISAARGTYVALLDADDKWEPDYLEVQVREMERDPSLSVLYPDAYLFGNPSERGLTFMDVSPTSGDVTFQRLLGQQCTVMISVLARRDALVEAGLFDESLRSCEDFDMWLRILKRGGRIGYHRRPLAHYRRRPNALSADGVRMCSEALRVLDKVRATMSLTPSEQRTLDRQEATFRARLRFNEGKRAFREGNWTGAIAGLGEANATFESRKLSLVLLLLRTMPRQLLWAYELRDRLSTSATSKLWAPH